MRPTMKLNLPKLDAQQNVFLARTLEHVDPANYYSLYAGLLGRRFVPLIEGVPREADSYNYKMITFTGQADIGAPGRGSNDDLIAGVIVEEVKCPIKEIPISFEWTMREIEQAAKYGVPLDAWTIQSAMSAVARKIDNMLAFGVTGTSIKGLLNNSSVLRSTATTKTGGQIEWTATVPGAEMLADIAKLLTDTRAALAQASATPGGDGLPAVDEWTILMPSFQYGLAGTTKVTTTGDSPTVLRYALDNFKELGLVAIEEWRQCATASNVGTGEAMMICYARNPLMVGALIPDEWTQRAPQEEGHKIVVPAVGLCGGAVNRYPVATRYMNLTD